MPKKFYKVRLKLNCMRVEFVIEACQPKDRGSHNGIYGLQNQTG